MMTTRTLGNRHWTVKLKEGREAVGSNTNINNGVSLVSQATPRFAWTTSGVQLATLTVFRDFSGKCTRLRCKIFQSMHVWP